MATAATGTGHFISIHSIALSKTNPRKRFDEGALAELADSIRKHGVLQPVLLRPKGSSYELVAGERRVRAAKAAALAEIPAIVRDLTDVEVLEIQVIENLQRSDLHPLEEAEGYRQLTSRGYDVAKIAERTGRSVKYVYDRVKLLGLTKKAQQLFLEGRFTPGHAILLARLEAKDQERALDPQGRALFEGETGHLWGDEEKASKDPYRFLKPVSVREFQTWVDDHVRFDAAKPDPMLFPETSMQLSVSREQAEKVIPITHHHYIAPETREGRTFGPQSWKRADGQKGSKTCDHNVTGVIVVGEGRGDAFKVCTAKEKCKTHWGAWQRERTKQAKLRGEGKESSAQKRYEQEEAKRKAEYARKDAARERWKKGAKPILLAIAAAVKESPAKPGGQLAKILLDKVTPYNGPGHAPEYVPVGKTAEDLVRHAAFLVLMEYALEYDAPEDFPKIAKAFGVDTKKILDEAVPQEKPAAPAKAKKKA